MNNSVLLANLPVTLWKANTVSVYLSPFERLDFPLREGILTMVARIVTVAAGGATQQFLFDVSNIQDQSYWAAHVYCFILQAGVSGSFL